MTGAAQGQSRVEQQQRIANGLGVTSWATYSAIPQSAPTMQHAKRVAHSLKRRLNGSDNSAVVAKRRRDKLFEIARRLGVGADISGLHEV
jgi:hypothetical protein